jgi:two-component sensor histidine kinase
MIKDEKISAVVAEDDFLVSEEIIRILKKIGCEHIFDVINGEDAVEMVCDKHPDIVLMDIKMPGLDGLEASRQISERCPTPIVILTAHDSQNFVEEASEAGVGAYITKPPNAVEIERAIRIARARHGDLMNLRHANSKLKKEIGSRKKVQQKLKGLLKEREILIKEVHHRVKNNFMVVSSLLSLQSNKIQNKELQDAFKVGLDRIHAMALIHEKLYRSNDLSRIDFGDYIQTLTINLYRSYNIDPSNVILNTDIEEVSLEIDNAIPCGLVLNELMTNSVKYAFPPTFDKIGELNVSLKTANKDEIVLIVSDNGIGLPEDIDIEKTDSLGLRLVHLLINQQLGGTIEIDRANGTAYTLRFKLK